MSTKIIMDVDTGTDDAVAIMTAALSPDIELLGITTVNGNCPVEICTENTLRVVDHIGAKIPVYHGCSLPLSATLTPGRKPNIPAIEPHTIHGHYLDLPAASSEKQSITAVEWLINTYLESDGDISLVPVGPLTNVAMAIRQAPEILDKIPEIVIMGGGHHVANCTSSAEFNIWVDPEAARVVMNCGRPIRLVTLDATHEALFTMETCDALKKIGTPAAICAAAFAEVRISAYDKAQPMASAGSAPIHDALAVCAIIKPEVISTVYAHVDVETIGELTDGRTVVDIDRSGDRGRLPPNAHVALHADEELFVEMMLDILSNEI